MECYFNQCYDVCTRIHFKFSWVCMTSLFQVFSEFIKVIIESAGISEDSSVAVATQ